MENLGKSFPNLLKSWIPVKILSLQGVLHYWEELAFLPTLSRLSQTCATPGMQELAIFRILYNPCIAVAA